MQFIAVKLESCKTVFKKQRNKCVALRRKCIKEHFHNITYNYIVSNKTFLNLSQKALHVECTLIPRGYYDDTSKTKFRRISTHFHVLFRCNFADQKIHVIFTYSFRHNFDCRKTHVLLTMKIRRRFW